MIQEASGSYEQSRAFVSALAWLPDKVVAGHMDHLLWAADPYRRRLGLAASVLHRCHLGRVLHQAIEHDDALVASACVRVRRRRTRPPRPGSVARTHLADESVACRDAAAWSIALLAGDATAVAAASQEIVAAADDRQGRGLQLAPAESGYRGRHAMDRPAQRRTAGGASAVLGAGVLGLPDMIPWVLEMMRVPELARIAGEAFSMITGVDIAYQDLDGEWPAGFDAGPNDDPADDRVAMDIDENLPSPDAKKLADWWVKQRSQYTPQVRHLCGKPLTEEWIKHILREGNQRQRAAAALELAIRRPGQPLFDIPARASQQYDLLERS